MLNFQFVVCAAIGAPAIVHLQDHQYVSVFTPPVVYNNESISFEHVTPESKTTFIYRYRYDTINNDHSSIECVFSNLHQAVYLRDPHHAQQRMFQNSTNSFAMFPSSDKESRIVDIKTFLKINYLVCYIDPLTPKELKAIDRFDFLAYMYFGGSLRRISEYMNLQTEKACHIYRFTYFQELYNSVLDSKDNKLDINDYRKSVKKLLSMTQPDSQLDSHVTFDRTTPTSRSCLSHMYSLPEGGCAYMVASVVCAWVVVYHLGSRELLQLKTDIDNLLSTNNNSVSGAQLELAMRLRANLLIQLFNCWSIKLIDTCSLKETLELRITQLDELYADKLDKRISIKPTRNHTRQYGDQSFADVHQQLVNSIKSSDDKESSFFLPDNLYDAQSLSPFVKIFDTFHAKSTTDDSLCIITPKGFPSADAIVIAKTSSSYVVYIMQLHVGEKELDTRHDDQLELIQYIINTRTGMKCEVGGIIAMTHESPASKLTINCKSQVFYTRDVICLEALHLAFIEFDSFVRKAINSHLVPKSDSHIDIEN